MPVVVPLTEKPQGFYTCDPPSTIAIQILRTQEHITSFGSDLDVKILQVLNILGYYAMALSCTESLTLRQRDKQPGKGGPVPGGNTTCIQALGEPCVFWPL